uniref:Uncharacterized protein n=1 Tax=Rhizophora mucronata TaxID=61149 RepID=A0A2P2NLP5_RHIMU
MASFASRRCFFPKAKMSQPQLHFQVFHGSFQPEEYFQGNTEVLSMD